MKRECRRSLICYDPNVRLNVEPDLARWRAVLEWMLARTHLLMVSEEDLGLLYPGETPAALASRWLAAGVALVVVTRGAEGALAWTARHHVGVPAVAYTMVDTVGAGDSFQCALLAWLAGRRCLLAPALRELGRADLAAALLFAGQAAAVTCTRRGADLPRLDELAGTV